MKKSLKVVFKNELKTTDDLVALGFWVFLKRRPKNEDLRPTVPRETENNTRAKFLRENKLRCTDGSDNARVNKLIFI